MIKVVVIKGFRDRESGQLRKVGEVFACTEARRTEILAKGDYIKD